MRKQWTMILASFVLMFAFTTATMAQGGRTSGGTVTSGCKLNEDGTSDCGKDMPPIRSGPKPAAASTVTSVSTASTSWQSVFWNWLTSF